MRAYSIKLTILLAILLAMPLGVRSQNISEIAKSDPLIITGSIGTRNTYRYSSMGDVNGSPLSNTIYANLNISLYGFSMPFSFYYSNDNLSFSYPQFSFDLHPTYKEWTGHFGMSSMSMSSYVMDMSFNGIGIEYNADKLRAGIFYGRLRKAINDNPADPAARAPQYKRMGWGFKVGYGTGKNYVDLYMLRAFDCIGSVDEGWRDQVYPQENIVVGLKGCVTPFNWLSFTANAATSVFTTDTRAPKISTENNFDKIFDTRYTSLARFAGDVSANLMFSGLTTTLSYRMIQPDYLSLGTNYMANNYHSLAVTASTYLFNKVALSATFSGQADNLTDRQMYTTCGYVYGANASMRICNYFNISANYNGYLQTQRDGTCEVVDSTKVHRRMSSVSMTPSFNYDTDLFGHGASLSFNYTSNKDLNKQAAKANDVKTMALGLSYSLNVKPWETDFSLSFSHQNTKGYNSQYSSDVGTFSASRSFLKEKTLNVSANLSLCYNEVKRQSKSLSIGGDFSVGYTLKKVHSFSASASFNKFGDVNITKTRSSLDCTDISASLNYVYTFTLLSIKRKAKADDTEKVLQAL